MAQALFNDFARFQKDLIVNHYRGVGYNSQLQLFVAYRIPSHLAKRAFANELELTAAKRRVVLSSWQGNTPENSNEIVFRELRPQDPKTSSD